LLKPKVEATGGRSSKGATLALENRILPVGVGCRALGRWLPGWQASHYELFLVKAIFILMLIKFFDEMIKNFNFLKLNGYVFYMNEPAQGEAGL
jgi:hypothetical protein